MTETLLLPAQIDLPEIKVQEIPPEVVEAFQNVVEAFQKIVEAFQNVVEAFQKVVEAFQKVVEAFQKIWDAIARGLVPKKWWHLYKYAKKRRVRKKYEKRIRERVFAILFSLMEE